MVAVGPRENDEWILWLMRFGSGDDRALAEMQQSTLEIVGRFERGRWRAALIRALQKRLRRLSTEVRQRLDLAVATGDVSAVLGWTRAQVGTLYCFSRVPAFTVAIRQWIERVCRSWLKQTQLRLERGVARSHDRELLLLTVRRSRLRWPPSTSTC